MATYYCSTDPTWGSWTATATTSSTTSTTNVWYYWTDSGTAASSSTVTTSSVWVTWVDANDQYQVTFPPPETAEQKAAREEREAEYARQAKIRQEKEKVKAEKARQLLKEVLSEQQNDDLDKKGFFDLVSIKSGQRYRINRGRSRNIQKLDDKTGRPIATLCFHPQKSVHDYDTMAIQKLMLEHDEEQVQRVANFS